MLTPGFTLSQCDKFVTIVIRVPFAKISDAEIRIDGCEFRFHSKPYFLRLTFPGELVGDEDEVAEGLGCHGQLKSADVVKATYDAGSGVLTVKVPKKLPCEHFPDLDFLTKLLAPQGARQAKQPLIEEIGPENADEDEGEESEAESEDFDWQMEQEPYEEEALSLDGPKYGFANQRSGVFKRLQSELSEAIDLPDADSTGEHQRTALRLAAELVQFNPDHYLADMYEPEVIQPLLGFKSMRRGGGGQRAEGGGGEGKQGETFTKEEREVLMTLPRKTYVLSARDKLCACYGLVDILYAHAYNHRATEGDSTVESYWTVSKLSATLSWLETWKWSSLHDVVASSVRRSLCYPLHRHWELSLAVLNDLQNVFSAGKARILSCLLDVRQVLSKADHQYILNDLYITDYCVWIQTVSEERIRTLSKHLNEITVKRTDIGLDLDQLELSASKQLKETRGANAASDDAEQTDSDDTSDSESSDSELSDSESSDSESSDSGSSGDRDTASDDTNDTPNDDDKASPKVAVVAAADPLASCLNDLKL